MESDQSQAKKPRIEEVTPQPFGAALVPRTTTSQHLGPPFTLTTSKKTDDSGGNRANNITGKAAKDEDQGERRRNKGEAPAGWQMTPWDQHSAVINLARFDYRGGEALLQGRSGFLITCGFRREKSATNEAMALLPEYLHRCQGARASVNSEGGHSTECQAAKASHGTSEERTPGTPQAVRAEGKQPPGMEAHLGEGLGWCERGTGGSVAGGLMGAKEHPAAVVEIGNPQRQQAEACGGENHGLRGGRGEGDGAAGVGGGKCEVENRGLGGGDTGRDGALIGGIAGESWELRHAAERTTNGEAPGVKERDSGLEVREAGGGEGGPKPDISTGLSLVKLGCMGVVFAALSESFRGSPVDVVTLLLEDIRMRRQNPLKWCQRMVPVQATCPPMLEAVQSLVSQFVRAHLDGACGAAPSESALRFAVAYKRRGPEADDDSRGISSGQKEPTLAKGSLEGSLEAELTESSHSFTKASLRSMVDLEKGTCVAAIASAVREAAGEKGAHVDLSSPQIVVSVEILPLPQAKGVCAISVLPATMFDVKPRLAIKSLARSNQ